MENKLFDVLVAAICNGTTDPENLSIVLLDEVYDLDDAISETDAIKLVNRFIDDNFIEADDVASKLNEEATSFLYEREIAMRGW